MASSYKNNEAHTYKKNGKIINKNQLIPKETEEDMHSPPCSQTTNHEGTTEFLEGTSDCIRACFPICIHLKQALGSGKSNLEKYNR